MSIIEVKNLSKDYETYYYKKGVTGIIHGLFRREKKICHAISDISFHIEKGESVAYIGPNGAGKSTTIKILSGILEPTDGDVQVCGIQPYKNRKVHAKNIGVIFGQRSQLWWDIPAVDSLNLMSYLYDIDKAEYKKRYKKFEELLEFRSFVNKPVRQLSLGQRVRIDFAAALLHNPKIVFLDEPTIGLDVVAKDRIREFVKYMNEECGVTVILTTHDMNDVEKICKRVILINEGTKKFDGSLNSFCDTYKQQRILNVSFNSIEEAQKIELTNAKKIKTVENSAEFIVNSDVKLNNLISQINVKAAIVDFRVKDEEIESVVRRVYQSDSKK